MRELVPGMNDKTDNATVFEQAANFLTFMREVVGNECDMVRSDLLFGSNKVFDRQAFTRGF